MASTVEWRTSGTKKRGRGFKSSRCFFSFSISTPSLHPLFAFFSNLFIPNYNQQPLPILCRPFEDFLLICPFLSFLFSLIQCGGYFMAVQRLSVLVPA
ncbi:unnamed protein product [Meloidogyne enterolobii]|uniref:Uncharacterized protein n=1 Tax=Meloidogyne enterolobii TaxID=390850 RepID=A0ACB1B667_MELEN